MITEDQLIQRGYNKHSGVSVMWPDADYFYQKRLTDGRGIKYFINLIHYGPVGQMPPAWMCEVTHNDPHTTFQQHRVEDLDLAETRCEKFWEMLDKPYYERNE